MHRGGILNNHLSFDVKNKDMERRSKDTSSKAYSKERRHKKLVKDIARLSGNKVESVKKPVRSELSKDVSEFTWASGKGDKVELHDLVSSLSGGSTINSDLRKNLKKLEDSGKTLDVALPKPQREKVERTVAYEEISKEISAWEPTVINNRKAEHLSFPLQSYKPPRPSIKSMVARRKATGSKTALEQEIEAVLKGSSRILERDGKELTAAEEEALKNVDVEEALERRKELQRLRVLQSYYEAKCKRVKKIKSKKYHRILKKSEKRKQEKTDLEELAKSDPTLFQSELDKAERLRALERASLRHRNSTKWAKNLITKGHLSTKDKQAINEQLRISRNMTEHKLRYSDSEEDEEEQGNEEEVELKLLSHDAILEENPWLLGNEDRKRHEKEDRAAPLRLKRLEPVLNTESQLKDDDSDDVEASSGEEWEKAGEDGADVKVPSDDKERRRKKSRKKRGTKDKKDGKERNEGEANAPVLENGAEVCSGQNEIERTEIGNEIVSRSSSERESVEVPDADDNHSKTNKKKVKKAKLRRKQKLLSSEKSGKNELEVTEHFTKPDQYLNVEKKAFELVPVNEDDNDDDDDIGNEEGNSQLLSLKEAFASDDVIEEFATEKRDIIEKAKPKNIDLTLPGWGEWGGAGAKVSNRKKRKFIKKGKAAAPRKDAKFPLVIINEDRSAKFAKTQVSSVPFPYSSKEQFEKSIRQPIGPQWNTPSVTSKLIEPRVSKLSGTMIEPIKPTKQLKKRKAVNALDEGNIIQHRKQKRSSKK